MSSTCKLDSYTLSLVAQGIVRHECSPAGCGRLPRPEPKGRRPMSGVGRTRALPMLDEEEATDGE